MKKYLKQKLYLHNSDSGLTILEVMIASTLSLLIVSLTMGATLANRDAYQLDIVRTRLNQNLRGAFDIINMELRQAGERLPANFPAIEIVDGANGAPDELKIRRSVLDEVLTVCQTIAAGTSIANVMLTNSASGTPPSCVYGGQTANYNAWKTYREGEDGDKARVYVFDVATRKGEYIVYTSESNVSPNMSIQRQSGTWTNTYTGTNAAVYALSDWHFKMSTEAGKTDLLQLIEDQDSNNARNIVFGITDFQIRALMQDGSVKTSFDYTDNWTLVKAIEVTISGVDAYKKSTISTTLTAQLFPRNVLSN